MMNGSFKRMKEPFCLLRTVGQRKLANSRPGDDEAVRVDRIGRARNNHHIARCRDRLCQICKSFLGSQGCDHFRFRIEQHTKTPPVIGGHGAAQTGNTTRGRIAVCTRTMYGLDQFFHNVGRRRHVRIAHTEVDNVFAGGARLCL